MLTSVDWIDLFSLLKQRLLCLSDCSWCPMSSCSDSGLRDPSPSTVMKFLSILAIVFAPRHFPGISASSSFSSDTKACDGSSVDFSKVVREVIDGNIKGVHERSASGRGGEEGS